MGGSGGGLTIYNVLLFYLVALLFIGYMSSLASVQIVTVGGNPYNIPVPSGILDIVGMFNFFVALLATNSQYQLFMTVVITPFVILLLYALAQLVRGTG